MAKTSSKTTRTTSRAKAARIRCVDGEPVLELRELVTPERELARLREAVQASRWGYVDAARVGVNIRATWGDAQPTMNGFNVTAGAKGVYLYNGPDDMGRDQMVQMALDMLTLAAGLHGLTTTEREKLGEIITAVPLFPRDAERADADGGDHAAQ